MLLGDLFDAVQPHSTYIYAVKRGVHRTHRLTMSLLPAPIWKYVSGGSSSVPWRNVLFSVMPAVEGRRVSAPRARGDHGMEPTPKCYLINKGRKS
jgi:hypothetical protein